MKSNVKSVISNLESSANQEYALDLVISIIQNELAIGYYLEVSAVTNTHVDITVVSPEICCPTLVKVPVSPIAKDEQSKIWIQIKEEISTNLKCISSNT